MALNRQQVFDVINTERESQDKVWPIHSGHNSSEHSLVLLDGYIRKAKDTWLTAADETPVVQQIAKIVAIAVRALEYVDGSEAVLKGLR